MLTTIIGFYFQQDNSRIHVAANVVDWFRRNRIKLFPHSAYSPDLNPIENVWSLLKDRLDKRFNGRYPTSRTPEVIEAFKQAIKEEWALIP